MSISRGSGRPMRFLKQEGTIDPVPFVKVIASRNQYSWGRDVMCHPESGSFVTDWPRWICGYPLLMGIPARNNLADDIPAVVMGSSHARPREAYRQCQSMHAAPYNQQTRDASPNATFPVQTRVKDAVAVKRRRKL